MECLNCSTHSRSSPQGIQVRGLFRSHCEASCSKSIDSHCCKALALFVVGLLVAVFGGLAGDWPEWRGPARDGISTETKLPEKWSPAGENLAWKAAYGGRSGPVVFGDRVYLNDTAGMGDAAQERLLALDANTGKLIWEQRFNVFLQRCAAASDGLGITVGRPRDGQYLCARCRRLAQRHHAGRKAALAALADGGIWLRHDARRAHGVAYHRR